MYQSPDFVKVLTDVKDVFASYCTQRYHHPGGEDVIGSCDVNPQPGEASPYYFSNPPVSASFLVSDCYRNDTSI